MPFNDRQAVEFASPVAIGDGAEMPPVGLTLDARRRFEADDWLLGFGDLSDVAQVIAPNGDAAVEAQGVKTLAHDHGGD